MPQFYKPKLNHALYGLHIPYNMGWDAWSRRNALTADKRDASGSLTAPDGTIISLWVTEVRADFSLSGQTGQSRMLREFFPHNLNDITLTIAGNVASTYEYNRLAAFVREHQWQALAQINDGVSAPQTLTLDLGNTYDDHRLPASGKGRVKGAHLPWQVLGYIRTMAAGAVRHEVAPEFVINFVITEAVSGGLIKDGPVEVGAPLKDMLQLLNLENKPDLRAPGSGFVQDPIAPPAPPSPTAVAAQIVSDNVANNNDIIAAADAALKGLF